MFLLEGGGGEPILLATAADIRARMRFRLAPPETTAASRRIDLRELAACVRWRLADSPFETDWQYLQLARAIYPQSYAKLLSRRASWFVRAHSPGGFPCLEPVAAPQRMGAHLGPFPNRASAARFVEILQDGFELCRHESILRRAPHGAACVYGQIGRCLMPCAGRSSMEQYRADFARAWGCAAARPSSPEPGDRREIRRELEASMRSLAGQMRFEQANLLKTRLARLAELEGEDYRLVAPLERFQFVLIQRGPSASKAKAFLVDRGVIAGGRVLDFPPRVEQLRQALAAMGEFVANPDHANPVDVESLALVTHFLFAGSESAGLAFRYDVPLTPERLVDGITAGAETLKLKPPKPRKTK